MRNMILNVTATGGWQVLSGALGFPRDAKVVHIQARADQTAIQYRYRGQTTYWTVKAGAVRTIIYGNIQPEELEVLANLGSVIEIEISTQLTI